MASPIWQSQAHGHPGRRTDNLAMNPPQDLGCHPRFGLAAGTDDRMGVSAKGRRVVEEAACDA